MAEGDSWKQLMGTATTSRQPSAGVEEMVTFIIKTGTTDDIGNYNGSGTLKFIAAAVNTSSENVNAGRRDVSNTRYIIDNTSYCRKGGTTDYVAIGGVQVG